jgi:circadian clock protein KaiC
MESNMATAGLSRVIHTNHDKRNGASASFPKAPTGIGGLDEITCGGLPRGRPTLICGSAGCGKTLLAMEFLVRGATQFGEPGVFMAFEETAEELTQNVKSLGFDLNDLVRRKKLLLDHVRVERSEIQETGEYDLEGLFIRLNHAIDSIGAKRVVLDTIESLFSGMSNTAILRAELRRLFRWLKDKGVTTIITGERGEASLTRQGLEEYVSDCVILLDHRVNEQISTRRLRIVKYRGSTHGTNEYPFLLNEDGVSVLPITSLGFQYKVSTQRISTGIPRLDAMLEGKGFYRGSSILLSGTSGTGKSTVAAHLAEGTCQRGEKCLYFAFEESESQISRNMRSVGIDLERWIKKGLLVFHASRPSLHGLEMHLVTMHKLIEKTRPSVVIIDPVTNLIDAGEQRDVTALLVRLMDYLKSHQITALLTSLTHPSSNLERTEVLISSLVDTWLLLRSIEIGGERNRGLYVLKSRGMAHSNQIREFLLTKQGVQLVDVYVGPSGVLTGSARLAQEAGEKAGEVARQQEMARRQAELERARRNLEGQILALQSDLSMNKQELQALTAREQKRRRVMQTDRLGMQRSRHADIETKKGANANHV